MNVQPQYNPFRPVTIASINNDSIMTSDVSMDHRSVLGGNLPVDDVPVGAAPQVCTGTMHVQTVGRQQQAKNNWTCGEC